MSLAVLGLVLVAALLHAGWNLIAKRAGGDVRFALLVALLIVPLWAPLAAWAGWDAVAGWGGREWSIVFASGLLHVAYFTLLLRGYRVADLTVVYPVARGSGPLMSSIVAVVALGERVTAGGAAGVLAITGGVFLIAGGPRLWRAFGDAPGAARQRLWQGIGHGAATGVFIAGYTVTDGYAVKVLLMSPILVDYFGSLCRIPFWLPAALRDRAATLAAWRAQWRAALAVAVISPLGYILVLQALRSAPISHVAPAREMSMLFATLAGGRLLGEGDVALRVAGAGCIALGVMALAVG